jgi:O-antigen/teichoic acid export membrane protein
VGIQVPILEGQGDQQEADRVISLAGTFTILVGAILGMVVLGFSFFVPDPNFRTALRFVAVLVALAQPYLLLREVTMARRLFVLRTKEIWLSSFLDFAAVVLLCHLFQLEGLGAASIMGILIPMIYLLRRQKIGLQRRMDFVGLKEMMRVGIPYSLTEGAFELVRRLDVLLIALLLGPTWVGYYSVSQLILDFSGLLTRQGVTQLLAPHLLREFGRSGSHAEVAIFYEQPARLFSYVLPPVLGVGAMLVAEFVRLFLPQYTPGIMAAEITLWSVFFMAMQSSMSAFLVAADKLASLLKVYAILIPVGALAQFAVIKAGLGLTGVAWTTMVLLALVTAIQICIARRSCGHGVFEITGFLSSLYLPFLTAILLKNVLDQVMFDDLSATPIQMTCKALLLLFLYLPVLLVCEKRFSMLRTVRQTV